MNGICIVVATGKEHRLGRWIKANGKNGAVVLEVPKVAHIKATEHIKNGDGELAQ